MILYPPAKINLSLRILNKLPSGYHSISSLMQTISLYDELTISRDKLSGIRVICRDISEKENIVYKSAVQLQKLLNVNTGAVIKLKKNIPKGAGLGGGSADAAYTIIGLLKLWKKTVPEKKLIQFMAQLGADVPFFYYGGCCIAEGIGEKLIPVTPTWRKKPLHILLINPGIHIPTKRVYELWDKSNIPDKQVPLNAFEPVVFNLYPELYKLKQKLSKLENVKFVSMSGSGSSFYAVFMNKQDSVKAGRKLTLPETYKKWVLTTVF